MQETPRIMPKIKLNPSINELGLNVLGKDAQSYFFPHKEDQQLSTLDVLRVKDDLNRFDKSVPARNYPSYELDLPDLEGLTPYNFLDHNGLKEFEELKKDVDQLADMPSFDLKVLEVPRCGGWHRYDTFYACWVPSEKPSARTQIIDCETYVKAGSFPVMAVSLSTDGLYLWLHDALVNNIAFESTLIPCDDNLGLVIGQSVSYDTARIDQSYRKNLYALCTRAMNIATCGIGNKLLPAYIAGYHSFARKWANQTSGSNDLVAIYNHHCKNYEPLDQHSKDVRNIFVVGNLDDFRKQLKQLIHYNVYDVIYTHRILKALWPKYRYANPELFTFAGHLIMHSGILPVSEGWDNWLAHVESTFSSYKNRANELLSNLALETVLDVLERGKELDIQLKQLDWALLTRGVNKGLPKWYAKIRGKEITSRMDCVPYILKVTWEGNPTIKLKGFGWVMLTEEIPEDDPRKWYEATPDLYPYQYFTRLPHPKGDGSNVGSPLAKDLIEYFNEGILGSENLIAREILEINLAVGYWTAKRKVISSFIPVRNGDKLLLKPDVLAHGTTTRRATTVFVTLGESKANVIGTELKSRIRSPKGYSLIGADFSTQELQIAAGFADKTREFIGSCAMSLIQYSGDKSDKSDGHSLLAKDAGIDRQSAKVLNFLMLYFGGVTGCALGLKKYNPMASMAWCRAKATEIVNLKRGKKVYERGDYTFINGTDSSAYNQMKKLVFTAENRLPISRSAISLPLQPRFMGSDYFPSRANRPIQSTGVDLLHLLICWVSFLAKKEGLDFTYTISIHDEVWYTVKDEDVSSFINIMQVAHSLTWAIFYDKFGFSTMPYNVLFFPGINQDKVLRKEVDLSVLTLSNQNETLEDGRLWTPQDLL